MLEKEIERKLTEAVKRIGGKAYKFISPGNDGVPDRLIVMPEGRIIFVELNLQRIFQFGFCPAAVYDFVSREFFLPELYDSHMTRGIPKSGDVLFTTEAPLGNVCRIPEIEGKFAVLENLDTQNILKDFEFGEIRNLADWIK